MNACKFLLILIIFQAWTGINISGQVKDSVAWWSEHSAVIQPRGHLCFGIVQPLRYGLSERIELSGSPFIFPIDPNIILKIRYSLKSNFIVTSEHHINFPTPFLRLICAEGIGGVISPQFKMPVMVSFYNGILISYPATIKFLITIRSGLSFAIHSEKPDAGSTIDLPLIFPRLAVYYNPVVLHEGFNLEKAFSEKIYGILRTEFFIIPKSSENIFFENRGILRWKTGRRFFIQGGYTLCHGKYPFGSQWHLLPNLDLGFRF
jgi:hypothetical protein